MTLIAHYELAIVRHEIQDDPMQRDILNHLQRVADELAFPSRWYIPWEKQEIKGLYLHGPVGIGKTYLVDLFYQTLPESKKARFHFHHFMQQIDAKLRAFQGKKDPLRIIAAEVAKTTRLLCFDEFLVHDVADAMILAELLTALFAKGIVLVVAANTAPDDLYLDGVQRDRFLPAIALMKKHCEVLGKTAHPDYRLGRTTSFKAYFSPLNAVSQDALVEQFAAIAVNSLSQVALSIQNRLIQCEKCSDKAVWFRFEVICNLPRSQLDYLEIADRFDTVFISDIPKLSNNDTVAAILLIHLIDVLYDRGIHLVISAAVSVEELYTQGEMLSTFQRTLSRLHEMQSMDYLARHPRRQVKALGILPK